MRLLADVDADVFVEEDKRKTTGSDSEEVRGLVKCAQDLWHGIAQISACGNSN